MRLLKREKEALASLLEEGAETPEQLAELFVKKLDELRAQRTHVYACGIVAGIPLTIGPYATRKQAEKALEKFGVDKKWIVSGWTEEGWTAHLEGVDAKPEPAKPNVAEQRKRESAFWAKARPLMDGEAFGLVCKDRREVEVKPLKLPRGAWG